VVTRSDPSFTLPPETGRETIHAGRMMDDGVSFSGHERDHLFLNQGDGQFQDVSGVSGADDPGDGRVFALLDFDRDGWPDIAEVNANAPSLALYRNRFGSDPGWRSAHNLIALRFVGANRDAEPAKGRSNRDGIGAVVTVDLGDRKLVRQHRAGEGFAAQNSSTMLVGIGDRPDARAITVRWPSGQVQTLENVAANRLLTIHEPGPEGPAEPPVEIADYARPGAGASTQAAAPESSPTRLAIDVPEGSADAEVRVFTTFATWCQACRADVPQFVRLREAFPPEKVALFNVPADEDDDRGKIEQWMAEQRPPYAMLLDLPPAQLAAIKRLLSRRLGREALPSTVVTDRKGEVLATLFGAPTVSDLRKLISTTATKTAARP
jgi:thiol-disulfide isomerase/thioredoxin